MTPVALTIAGSDPSGGAGIQADLKSFHQFGVYGEAVLTLLTVQNTCKVSVVETVSPELVRAQIEAVISDVRPGAIKTGALGSAAIIDVVAGIVRGCRNLVVDPVIVSKHGSRLLPPEAESILLKELIPHAYVVTPNIAEAEVLSGMKIRSIDDALAAGRRILDLGCKAVLVKGGHLPEDPIDLLVSGRTVEYFRGRRVDTKHTHGTGCTYSAAITAGLAKGKSLSESIKQAKGFIQRAIETAPGLGAGFGPLNHFAEI